MSAPRDVVGVPAGGWVCSTAGCKGDGRYAAPGRGHVDGCTHPLTADDSQTQRVEAIRARLDEAAEDWLWHESTDELREGYGAHMGQMLYRLPVDGQTQDMKASIETLIADATTLLDLLTAARAVGDDPAEVAELMREDVAAWVEGATIGSDRRPAFPGGDRVAASIRCGGYESERLRSVLDGHPAEVVKRETEIKAAHGEQIAQAILAECDGCELDGPCIYQRTAAIARDAVDGPTVAEIKAAAWDEARRSLVEFIKSRNPVGESMAFWIERVDKTSNPYRAAALTDPTPDEEN